MVDKKTCWYTDCYDQMIAGATGVLWPKLEDSSHYPVLRALLEKARRSYGCGVQLCDIGCGAGDLFNTYEADSYWCYTGVDLKNIIDNVTKKHIQTENLIDVDFYEADEKKLSFLQDFDCIVMNAFIDVLETPLSVLSKILKNATKFVVIHRQFLTSEKTFVTKHSSYGGYTYISHINTDEFNKAFESFYLIESLPTGLGENNYSFLYKRIGVIQ